MDNAPRKASDIILSLEQKVDQLIKSNAALDFNVKILSNKLNSVLDALSQGAIQSQSPSFATAPPAPYTAATPLDPVATPVMQATTQSLPILKEHSLQIDRAPEGFRRTSRPDGATTPPSAPTVNAPPVVQTIPTSQQQEMPANMSKIAVQQRVVDRNGKAVFLADVEIKDVSNGQVAYKGRTSSVGKWVAPLPAGRYQVTISKRESATREQLSGVQNLVVDGLKTPLDLQMAILN